MTTALWCLTISLSIIAISTSVTITHITISVIIWTGIAFAFVTMGTHIAAGPAVAVPAEQVAEVVHIIVFWDDPRIQIS